MLAALILTVVLTPPPVGGVVLRAVDGDTVDLLTDFGPVVRVRLIGVDTPELHRPGLPVQPGAIEAHAYTRARLVGHRVKVTGDRLSGRDPYGRALGYVWVDRKLFNRELIDRGMGAGEFQYPFERLRPFAKAETLARLSRRGVWSRLTTPETHP